MAQEIFQLRFKNNEDTIVSIDEPINFATVDFQLSQKEKGYGRDVSFNGGEIQFEFVKYRNHYLDKLLYYNNTYGFESIVDLIIICGNVTTIIGELDFATAITDDLEYFKCKVIQQSNRQIVKRRKAVKVDLLSDKDIDGNAIEPLVKKNLILIAKPIFESSRLEQTDVFDNHGVHSYGSGRTNYRLFARNLVDYSVITTYSPIDDGSTEGVKVLTATASSLRNITINVSEFTCKYELYNKAGSGDANGYFGVRWGNTFSSASGTEVKIPESIFSLRYGRQSVSFTKGLTAIISELPAGHSIWIYHSLSINHSGGQYSAIQVTQGLMNIDITAETLASDSVVYSFRLIDVMKQVVKSISGLDVNAPRFDVGGEFYDNRLVSGNFLRKIDKIVDEENKLINKAFLVSLEDLEKSMSEMNGDWEITDDNEVFFGIEEDFYTDIQLKEFTNAPFSSFNKSFNPKFTINEFHYGYKTYQSLKEKEELFSGDVVNGESKWVLQNKSVENKKEVSIEWIRDSFSIETNRRKAIEISTSSSSQEDDSLFIIDSTDTVASAISESNIFSHFYEGDSELLKLSSEVIDFTKLTFNVGDKFDIVSPTTINIGKYLIRSISEKILELERQSDITGIFSDIYYTHSTGYVVGISCILFFTNQDNDKNLQVIQTIITPPSTLPTAGQTISIFTSSVSGIYLGTYEISDINTTTRIMNLRRTSDTSATDNVSTSYEFTLNPLVNPFISYTNDGFTNVKNIIAPDKFANLRYSIKRNIQKYWRNYLTTCNLYKRIQPIKNTVYKNNKFFSSSYDGLSLVESHDIATSFEPPILSPFIYNDVVFANVEFNDFIALQNAVRTDRGYIRTYDNNGLPIELYPISMKYENLTKELTIKAEEKFVSNFVATIETLAITDISSDQASSGGTILSNGYLDITAKGVVWGTEPNPTIALETKTNQGTGNGSFVSRLTSLTQDTLYYVRAYATTSFGTGYGNEIAFTSSIGDYSPTDYDSEDYSVTI
jgi:hypothetical protein